MEKDKVDWEMEWALINKKNTIWVMDNAQKIAEEYSFRKEHNDVKKIKCVYFDEWGWADSDILDICMFPCFAGTNFSFSIHHEDLDNFIEKYLDSKDMQIIPKVDLT